MVKSVWHLCFLPALLLRPIRACYVLRHRRNGNVFSFRPLLPIFGNRRGRKSVGRFFRFVNPLAERHRGLGQ
jgi:hypothetical protein